MKILLPPLAFMAFIVIAYLIMPFGPPQAAALLKDFLPAMATFVAAWIGASLGASFTREAAQRDERKRQIGAGARAMFTLWRQVNILAQIQVDFIDDHREKSAVAILLPPIDYPLDDIPRLDHDSLAFVLDLGNATLLETLVIAEQNFLHAVEIVRKRSKLHLEEVQPILEKIIPRGGPVTHAQLEQALGPRLFSLLIDQTKKLIFRVDRSVVDLDKAAMDLYTTMKTAFPETKFPKPSEPSKT